MQLVYTHHSSSSAAKVTHKPVLYISFSISLTCSLDDHIAPSPFSRIIERVCLRASAGSFSSEHRDDMAVLSHWQQLGLMQ